MVRPGTTLAMRLRRVPVPPMTPKTPFYWLKKAGGTFKGVRREK